MTGNVGIPISLFIFVGILAFSITYQDWRCGRLFDKACLDIKPAMPIILALLCAAAILALLAAILYAVYVSTELKGLAIAAALLTVLTVCCNIAAVFYFYLDKVPKTEWYWCQLMAMFGSGLGLGIMICLLGTFCENL
ncbi:unnamed protein product [Hymenolepis diminuta]|uniref:MARVEL domain-containing protein n=1 Tax=Hymenolepis diminuta TaxID=6216 RepID=A0A0R3SGC3_HYMDI|nr:unnamed protein product [Hymenolepis diminuta]VUZ46489.1 unnamed protein product [Hymenolepis diminuta]